MPLFEPYYRKLGVMHVGCEAPRAYFIPYDTMEGALGGRRMESAYFRSLCGAWDFRFFHSPLQIEALDIGELDRFPADKMDVPRSWGDGAWPRLRYAELYERRISVSVRAARGARPESVCALQPQRFSGGKESSRQRSLFEF